MILFIVAMILINWLLAAAWIVDPWYAFWALVVTFLWWFASFNRKPLWPSPARRGLLYIAIFLWFLAVALVIEVPLAFLVPAEILALMVAERLIRRSAVA
jgi:hypothetical protein